MAAAASGDTGLVIVDFQNEYFGSAEGKIPCPDIDEAAKRGGEILASFREKDRPIIHVKHIADLESSGGMFEAGKHGAEIHDSVKPIDGEPVLEKHRPCSFHNTKLEEILRKAGVKNLVVIGAMTHMCVNDTARSAMNLGFATTVVDDACTTMDIARGDAKIDAKTMHTAALGQMEWIGAIISKAEDVVNDKVEWKQPPAWDWVS